MQNRRDSVFDSSQIPPDLRALACKSVEQIVQIQNIRTDYKVLEMPGLLQEEQRKTNFRTAKSCNVITPGTMRYNIIAQSVLGERTRIFMEEEKTQNKDSRASRDSNCDNGKTCSLQQGFAFKAADSRDVLIIRLT
jgi:hypothetical protein